MSLSIHAVAVPVLVNTLTNMRSWLERADVQARPDLVDARLIEDMRPLTAQYQLASDSAKNGMARLAGVTPPVMPDTEISLAELQARCDATIAFVSSITPAQLDGAEVREVQLLFPSGNGFRFDGLGYVTTFLLPNLFFHASTAYAILRAQGIAIGKQDFLAHMGPPNITA